jgi:hypothetical protein
MAWEAIHCDKALERATIVRAIAEALGVDEGDLSVAERIELARPDARVLVAARVTSGEYPQSLDIITGGVSATPGAIGRIPCHLSI